MCTLFVLAFFTFTWNPTLTCAYLCATRYVMRDKWLYCCSAGAFSKASTPTLLFSAPLHFYVSISEKTALFLFLFRSAYYNTACYCYTTCKHVVTIYCLASACKHWPSTIDCQMLLWWANNHLILSLSQILLTKCQKLRCRCSSYEFSADAPLLLLHPKMLHYKEKMYYNAFSRNFAGICTLLVHFFI